MQAFAFGPVYCETLAAVPGVYPAEPVNTYSSLVIIAFAVAAARIVQHRCPRAYDLYVLCGLLVVTDIGSALWHGLRQPWALAFDVTPGLIFLFAIVFVWARRLWSTIGAMLMIAAFFIGFTISRPYWNTVQRWVALAPVVVIAGVALIAGTAARSRRAALLGAVSLSCGLIALAFRTYDLAACAYIPFGTHFLWHLILSAGGFVGIVALTGLLARTPVSLPASAE